MERERKKERGKVGLVEESGKEREKEKNEEKERKYSLLPFLLSLHCLPYDGKCTQVVLPMSDSCTGSLTVPAS